MTAKDNLKELLRELHGAHGVSGHEQEVIKVVYNQLKGQVDELHVSTTGNVIAIKKGARPGPNMAIGVHLDEVGFIVRNILPNGFLTVDKVGFPTEACAIGRKVWVGENRIPGTFGIRPGHLMTPEEASKVLPVTKNYIDLGCSSADEVRSLGIKLGDQIVIQSDFMEMHNPDFICTRAIDNRINCSILIDLLKNLKAEDFGGTLYGIFTVREETGLHGAAPAVENYPIDYVIALDTVPSADTPGSNPAVELPLYLGKGPAYIVCEGNGLNFQISHPALGNIIETGADKAGINLQTVTLAFAGYLTDASAYAYAKAGLPTCTLACPRRYSHSPVEMMNMNDAADLLKLLQTIVADNENADLRFVKLD